MKTIPAFFAVALLAGLASAATHYVDINGLAPYTQVQPAINAASAEDTVVVAPGYDYSGFTVDRRLVIIGAGTSIDATEGTRIGGIVTVTDAADSTELQGLWIVASVFHGTIDSGAAVLRIRSGARGVFVLRCLMENTNVSSYAAGISLGISVPCSSSNAQSKRRWATAAAFGAAGAGGA